MKTFRVGFACLAVALLLLLAGGTPQAFHSGGVAECSGCHSMHAPNPNGSFLLVGAGPSSTCLSCHQSSTDTGPNGYHISTIDSRLGAGLAPLQRTPGGDFGWVKKGFTWSGGSEGGAVHGHNIVATDFNYLADPTNTTAPGGTYSSAQLGCESCHDPHGRVRRRSDGSFATGAALGGQADPIIGSGSYNNSLIPAAGQAVGTYRLLRGLNDTTVAGVTFTGVAIAVTPATYNRTEAATQTRTAYGAAGTTNTWGTWCASCHPDMHSAGNAFTHPVDETLGTIANVYNAYIRSGNLTGSAASSFSSLVPFAENTGDFATLASHAQNNDSYLNGPSTQDRVTCMSCHRAHASGMMYGLRFDTEYEFMVKAGNYVGTDNPDYPNWGSRAPVQARGRTMGEWQAAYYDRPATQFASYQRVLCNKCHAKD